jgi:hypothetical protein
MPGDRAKAHTLTAELLLLAALIETTLILMGRFEDLRHHVVETVAILLATSIFYIFSVWLILRIAHSARRGLLLLWILLAAIAFRLTVFPLYPALSDDVHRYRWEGMIQAAGFNPYARAPADPALVHLRDSTYPRVVGKEARAVYGPLLELEERWGYRLLAAFTADPENQIFWFKLFPAAADIGVIAAVCLLLRVRRLPLERVLVYAWCPLPVFEFWATGHNDSFLILFLVLGLAFAARGSGKASYLFLALSAMAKFWPALLIPSFTGANVRRLLGAGLTLAAVTAVLSAPYWTNVTRNVQLTTGFLGGWRNNDSLHTLIAALTPDPYIAKYVTTGLIALSAILIAALPWRIEARALAFIVTMLALSANVHTWYLTWMVPLLAIYPAPALLLWIALMPLTYAAVIDWAILGEWDGVTPWRWLVYGPVAAVALFQCVTHRWQMRKRPAVNP